MKNNKLTQLICYYKESSLFIAAFEVGIFRYLHESRITLFELAKQVNIESEKLLLLMLVLKKNGLVIEKEGLWSLSNEMDQNFSMLDSIADMIHHERNIFQNWMGPVSLEQALYAPEGGRIFDKKGFSKEEQILYDKAMYGKNLAVLGIYLMRHIRQIEEPVIAEYGRSRDKLLNVLLRSGGKFKGYCMPEDYILKNQDLDWTGNYQILSQDVKEIKFDIVLMYNTIHYYNKKVLEAKLIELGSVLKESAHIFVIDLFYHGEDEFSVDIMVDWISHGGIYFITHEELIAAFEKRGFKIIKTINLQDINSSILEFQNGKDI